MKTKIYFILTLSLIITFSAIGATLVSVVGSTVGRTSVLTATGCCNNAVYAWYIDTPTYRDFNASEADDATAYFLEKYGDHAQPVTGHNSTRAYNCHSYVFNESNGVIRNPFGWLGPFSGCWMVNYTEGSPYCASWDYIHSAKPGQNGYTYRGKCGGWPLSDHDDYQYGPHWTIWSVLP